MFNFFKSIFGSNNKDSQSQVNMALFENTPPINSNNLNKVPFQGSQHERVRAFMSDGSWRDLEEIVEACGGTAASVSARLRDLRKEKFGSHTVNTMRVGGPKDGYWMYQVLLSN